MEFILGDEKILEAMHNMRGEEAFSESILRFCGIVSQNLMRAPLGRKYPDVTTLGFWLRRGALVPLKKKYMFADNNIRLGRGVIFHIAPSNVPVNFAYSLFAGLLCGNANVVRVPSRNFPQVLVIIDAIRKAIMEYPAFADKICLVRYGHSREDNDKLSSLCDVRVIWGGDATIQEIRKSPLSPRSTEVTFADRFSLAVIDVDAYRLMDDKEKNRIARGFYNDTYLTDQNACTSPKLVVWYGPANPPARDGFWKRLWRIVEKEYAFQDIQGVDKLTSRYLLAARGRGVKNVITGSADNRLVRVELDSLEDPGLKKCFGNSGYFLEYETLDIMDLSGICNDTHCQTISYVGNAKMINPLLLLGIKGVDRIVPVGRTMDFGLTWDGYNLVERFMRNISIG